MKELKALRKQLKKEVRDSIQLQIDMDFERVDKHKVDVSPFDKSLIAINNIFNEIEIISYRSCESCKKWIGNNPFKGFCSVTGSTIDLGGCNDYFEVKGHK